MKKSISLLLLSLLMIAPSCQKTKEAANEYNIVPKPNQILPQEGRFELNNKVCLVVLSDAPEVKSIADSLAEQLKLTAGISLKEAESADGKTAISFVVQEGMPKEGYKLSVTPSLITLTASQPNGFFYGVQTLYQLLPPAIYGKQLDKKADWSVPAVEIEDSPRFVHRGLMLDVCRHYVPIDYIYKFIDLLAMNKMNVFHWHLTDDQGWRIEIKKYPELAEIGGQLPNNGRKRGYYTQEEFKDLVNYANERFITIIPEVDIPGHTAAVFAAYPDFKNAVKFKTKVNIPGQAFNALDVDDPKAMQFTEDVIAELAALAPGNYIHIGGDEAIGLPHDKFVRFINKTREIVLKNGKKMVGWQETARADISEGDVIQHWIYLKQKSENSSKKKDNIPAEYKEIMALFAEFMKEAPKDPGLGISKKAKVILSPSGYVYLDHKYLEPSADSTQNAEQERLGMAAYEKQTIQEMYDWDPMTFNPTVENPQKDVAGIEAAIWCETITNFRDLQFLLMPRLAGVAEKGWSKVENTHWDEYKVRLGAQAPLWEKADWNYFKSSLVDWK